MKLDYPGHYIGDRLIWITQEDEDHIHFIVDSRLYSRGHEWNATQEYKNIVEAAMSYIRDLLDNKIDKILN